MVKYSIGSVEAKKLICMSQGPEVRVGVGNVGGRGCAGYRGTKGGDGATVIA